jgi:hypothetical protein
MAPDFFATVRALLLQAHLAIDNRVSPSSLFIKFIFPMAAIAGTRIDCPFPNTIRGTLGFNSWCIPKMELP